MEGVVRDGGREAVAHPNAPPPGTKLCRLDQIADPSGREFVFGWGPAALVIFVVRRGSEVYGYVNVCPHTRAPINWSASTFLDPSRKLIQCATHGARFRIDDGLCTSGPCKGESLTPVPVRLEDGNVVIAEE